MAMTPEAKAAAEAAVALKLANEKKFREERFNQLKVTWLAEPEHAGKILPPEEVMRFHQRIEAEIKSAANVQPAEPLSESQKALKEQMSKFSSAFKGSRFPFIGTGLEAAVDFFIKLMPAFQAIIPMIQNVSAMFNPSAARVAGSHETPLERVKGLVEAGNLDGANDVLQREDLKLIHDMEKAFESDKDVKEFKENEVELKGCYRELKTLENDLERLATLKLADDKNAVAAQLATIQAELKGMREHHATLSGVVTAAGESLKNLPIIFQSMGSILEATQKLCDKEVAGLARPAAPPAPQ